MIQNQQSPSKSSHEPGLLVHSIFYTIQGEGPFIGEPAVFVRLAGCNLQCPMCDTEYTSGAIRMQVETLIFEITKHWTWGRVWVDQPGKGSPLVVITGGEPFRQPIGAFVSELLCRGIRVQIETNGTLYQDDIPYGRSRLMIVCSPKAGKVNKNLEPHIGAYKYVLSADDIDPSDGLPNHALGLPGKVARPSRPNTPIYVNPMDEQDAIKNQANLKVAASICLKFGYRLGVQLHKLAGLA